MEVLKETRKKIDSLDDEIIRLLGKRYECVRRAGEIKAEHNLDLVQRDRVEEVLGRVAFVAHIQGLDPEFVKTLYSQIIRHAHEVEQKIIDHYDRS